MAFPTKIKPPRTQGRVPADYRGPLYYRTHVVSFSVRPLWESLSLEKRVKALAEVEVWRAAERKDPRLCDANGDLLPELRRTFPAYVKKNARKSWDEMSWHVFCLVSERVRNVIEELAPGVHYFVRNDVDDRQGNVIPVYALICGLSSGNRPALSLEANGISWTPSTTGHRPVYKRPDCVQEDNFGYLDASVMNGAPFLYDYETGHLFSQELVDRLGHAVSDDTVFVPMGVV